MVFATLLLICSIPQMDDTARVVNDPPAVVSDSTAEESALPMSLPAAPTPKVKADPQPIAPNPAVMPFEPAKPMIARPRETQRQRVIWYGLVVAGHSGAAFDAWSTKRAVTGGYGQEGNPFLRPFAGSNAIYAATQVSPAVMDFIGKRMMLSENKWMRKLWWVPQVAGASFSFTAGAHNVGVVH